MSAEGFSAKVSWKVSEFLNAKLYKGQRGSPHFCWMLLWLDVMSGTMAAICDHESARVKMIEQKNEKDLGQACVGEQLN